jgi:hypothetical protein
MRRLVGLPVEIEPFSIVSIGQPMDEVPPIDRFDRTRIRTNRW